MLEEEEYISLKKATEFCTYTQEYLSLRARQGKLKAVKFGRNWVTRKDWLQEYLETINEYNQSFNNFPTEITEENEITEEKKIVLPPRNLPVENPLKLRRLVFSSVLVFTLLISGFAFGKINSILVENFAAGDVPEIFNKVKSFSDEAVILSGELVENFNRGLAAEFENLNLKIENSGKVFSSSVYLASVGELLEGYGQWIIQSYLAVNDFIERKLAGGYQAMDRFFSRTVVNNYLALNDWLEEKIGEAARAVAGPFVKAYQFLVFPWRILPSENIVFFDDTARKELENLQQEISRLKEEGLTVKEVGQLESLREITREVVKVDNKALSDLQIRLALFESETKQELAKRIQGINIPNYSFLSPSGASSVSTLGTITSGTWNASTINVTYGGTGLASVPAGYTLIGDSSDSLQATSTLFVSSDGNVGIGTTTPAYALDVNGTIRASAILSPYQHTIVVAESGGDYTTITDALDSITDNDSDNRYLIKVMPGTFDESIAMKPYVDISGSGQDATVIGGSQIIVVNATSSSMLEKVTLNASISVGSGRIKGIYNNGGDNFTFRDSKISISSSVIGYYGIELVNASLNNVVDNIEIDASSQNNTNNSVGILADGGSTIYVYNSRIAVDQTADVWLGGLQSYDSGSVLYAFNTMVDVTLSVTNPAVIAVGLYANSASDLQFISGQVNVTVNSIGYGVYIAVEGSGDSSALIENSKITVVGSAATAGVAGILDWTSAGYSGVTIRNTTVSSTNSAGHSNAYMNTSGASTKIYDSELTAIAVGSGKYARAARLYSGGSPFIRNSIFTGTGQSSATGEGVYVPSGASPTIINSKFSGTATDLSIASGGTLNSSFNTYSTLSNSGTLNDVSSTGSGNLLISGSMGIGTTTPSALLDVYASSTAYALNVNQTMTGGIVNFQNATGSVFTILNNGNVGIGTASPNNLLSVYDLIDFNNTDFNTKLGYQAGKNIVAGAQNNTFLGYQAGLSNATLSTNVADNNTAIGYQSLLVNRTGKENVSIGSQAMAASYLGSQNTVVGVSALGSTAGGSDNTAMGYKALFNDLQGSMNSAFGHQALFNVTTGGHNVAVGNNAGYSITTNNNNTFIGYSAGYNALQKVDVYNSMALGYEAYTTANNQVVIGNTSITQTLLNGNVGIGTTTPVYTLDVYGNARLGTSTASSLFFRGLANFNDNFYINTSGIVATGTWQGTPIAYNYGGTGTSTPLALQNLWWGDGAGNLVQVASSTLAGSGGVTSLNTLTGGLTLWGTNNNLTVTASSTAGLVFDIGTDVATTGVTTLSSLTSVGTIGTGTWQGTAIADAYISSAATWNTLVSSQWTSTSTGIYYSGGNVGIGTTAPTEKLTVSGGNILTNNVFATKSVWTDRILESSNSQYNAGANSLGGRSKGDAWVEAGTDVLPTTYRNQTSLVYDGKMWVIGGAAAGVKTRKVYSSTDGITWTEAGTDALPVATEYHTSLVYDGKMWMIGGSATGGITRKVYYSTDGITWTESGTDALPVATLYHTSLVYDGRMWVIGGSALGSSVRKVYSSTDGITWTEAGTDALPAATRYHTSLVYDGRMWVIGGYIGDPTRKVYSSTDGITWTEAGTNALPVATYNHTSVVYDSKMWVIGGYDGDNHIRKVYYSTNGITWTESGTNALPAATNNNTSLVYDGKMWVIGGYDLNWAVTSKVYYSLPAIKGGLVIQGQSNTELFRITPTGNVGIGTTTPSALLDIYASSTAYALNINQTMTGGIVNFQNATGSVFTILNNGNVGIGTANPTSTLEVLNSSDAQLTLSQTGSANYAKFKVDSAGDLRVAASGNDLKMTNDNLWLCSGGTIDSLSCPSLTLSDTGNLVVENDVYVDDSGLAHGEYKKICPAGYVWIPGNSKFGTEPGFCVMIYEAKCDDNSDGSGDTTASCKDSSNVWKNSSTTCACISANSKAVVSSEAGYPITYISQRDAETYCRNLGEGYHLVTDQEWMTIATDVLWQANNWTSGVVGTDCLFRGNSGETTCGYDGRNPDYGTEAERTGLKANAVRAKFKLSTGEYIWDISGNVFDWTENNVLLSEQPQVSAATSAWGHDEYTNVLRYNALSYIQPTNRSWNSSQGIGKIYTYSPQPTATSSTQYAFLRGGFWGYTACAGVFTLSLSLLPAYTNGYLGFRCAR